MVNVKQEDEFTQTVVVVVVAAVSVPLVARTLPLISFRSQVVSPGKLSVVSVMLTSACPAPHCEKETLENKKQHEKAKSIFRLSAIQDFLSMQKGFSTKVENLNEKRNPSIF